MRRVSAPLVLLSMWLLTVACSPHALRIGKCCSAGTLGLLPEWAPSQYPRCPQGTLCNVPSSLAGPGWWGGAADKCPL